MIASQSFDSPIDGMIIASSGKVEEKIVILDNGISPADWLQAAFLQVFVAPAE